STVVALKSSFLRTQTRILSQPLQPSEQWRNNSRERGTLTDAAIAEATRELNRQVRRHNKAAYSSLAIRHVAEQIDKLYWVTGAPILFDDDHEATLDGQDPILRIGDDLCSDVSITKLPEDPEELEEISSARHQLDNHDRYTVVLEKIKDLSQRRAALQNKVRAYKRLASSLEPFKDPQTTVQPNLVTRDGQLADGVARSSELNIRVGARLD
ncbi:hypothetical protein NA57DRAFT_25135, partial [Rhizodiscina lignyota]